MLTVVTGPFHPDLETALASQVRSLKQGNPLAPALIVVPSRRLARRVKWLLAVEHRLALLEIYVLTFYELAKRLIEDGPAAMPTLADGLLREELLRSLAARGVPGTEMFRDWGRMRGLWGGLWATMQDLKEGRVDPATALAAMEEGRFPSEDAARLAALLRLYGGVLGIDRTLRLADPDDLAALATACTADSTFLQRMAGISYYGFYDLTQSQLDFFRAVAVGYPTTLFFPLRQGRPAYRFAERFFATHIQGLADRPLTLSLSPQAGRGEGKGTLADEMLPAVRSTCRIVSVVGYEDEVSAAAKEILRLMEDHDVDPLEIGVVARTMDPYLPVVRRVFDDNKVPFSCAMGEPLIHEPLAKTIVRFLRLRVEAFPRASVLDVLCSPALRLDAILAEEGPAKGAPPAPTCELSRPVPCPDTWEWITRGLGITRGDPAGEGLGEWHRLEGALRTPDGLDDQDGRESHERSGAAGQRTLLWRLVKRMHADLAALPPRAGWGDYVERFTKLLPEYFDLSAWDTPEPSGHSQLVQATIRGALSSVEKLDVLGEDVSLKEWTDVLVHALERARLSSESGRLAGVQVLDVMDARGVPFRALFVLGLNEKIFPRSIREDALLRDAEREVLSRDLGFKIARKLDGFDEERLLFALLLGSAQERLYLSYQRADRTGRTLIPSGYLVELERELWGAASPSVEGARERRIKRRPSERWTEWPYDRLLLTRREMGLAVLLRGGSIPACRLLYDDPDLLERSAAAMKILESPEPGLTPHDGLVGPLAAHWRGLEERGIAPTSLETYAQCPFQYFARQVLRLQPMHTPESVVELDARARGELCHALLRAFYERVSKTNPLELEVEKAAGILAEAASPVFADFERSNWVGYPLLWSLAKEEVLGLVGQFLREDLSELRESGYRPLRFEVEAKGQLDSGLPIRGILDRVDVRKENGRTFLRVVDYKYTQSSAPRDKDLVMAAVRGVRLQPPLYLLAVKDVLGEPAVPESAAFYFLAPNRRDASFGRSRFDAVALEGDAGARIERSVTLLLDGIKAGRFFILPGGYCDRCDYSEVCRQHHTPSWWRARTDGARKELEHLRTLKAPKTSGKDEKRG